MARAKRRANQADNGQSEFDNELENEIENGEENAEEMGESMREMGNAAQRQLRHAQHKAIESFDLFGGPVTRLMDQNWTIFQKLMHAMREESVDFVNRRLEQTSQAIENSRDCNRISDLLSVQQEWMLNFARDYVEQTKRFGELVRDLAQDGTANVSNAASEVAERGRSAAEDETRHAAA
jgi:hypothetical protein